MTAKINTSVRISTEAIENIERLASAHNWTRNQAINLVLEGRAKLPSPKIKSQEENENSNRGNRKNLIPE